MKKTDAEIQQDVLRELKWDTRVEETEVGVQVDSGIVTLSGNVGSWAKRGAAEAAAHRVAGVLDVANDLKVMPQGGASRTDTDIAHAVRHALTWDVFVPESRIRSTVSEGMVTLEGEVDFGSEREDAERAVRNLAGVRWVNNKIFVKPPKVLPEEVRESIQNALERQADLEAKKLKIDVQGDQVTLSGAVHTWVEKNAALWAARATPGVRTVDDRLLVQPSPT